MGFGTARRVRMIGLPRRLSARLLLNTVGFVLLAELLLFVPSLASFRQDTLHARAKTAALVTEALSVGGAERLTPSAEAMLAKQFMKQTDADFLAAFADGQTMLILGDGVPGEVAMTEDLRKKRRVPPVARALRDVFAGGEAYLRLIAPSPVEGHERLELFVPCAAIGAELRAYAGRIALLSLLIALFVGGLIFLVMRRLIVAPVERLASDMMAFRDEPLRRRGVVPEAGRSDEIGQLQREFHDLKQSVREAFRQRERLANLGLSVTKINHDLRNVLSTALLMADRLSLADDPELAAMGERLTRTVERGVGLTEEVLEYSSAREPQPELEAVSARRVAHEVRADLATAFPAVGLRNDVGEGSVVRADAEQLHRILSNLARNAAQAMAGQPDALIRISCEPMSDTTLILKIADNGPGLPEKVEDRLFLPFTRGDTEGSTGLGLSISKELAENMGGSLELLETGPDGTAFILGLPRA